MFSKMLVVRRVARVALRASRVASTTSVAPASYRQFHLAARHVAPASLRSARWMSDSSKFSDSMAEQSFESADLDKDGLLNRNEFTALVNKLGLDWTEEHINASFDGADTNKDGVIQPEEWQVLLHKAVGSSGKSTTATQAEGEEAEISGYTGMLKDSETIVERLKAMAEESSAAPEAAAEEEPVDEGTRLQKELTDLQEKFKARRHEVLLSLADFENNKKRFTKERDSRKRAANVNFAQKMVDLFIEFDTLTTQRHGKGELSDACQSFREGIVMTRDLYRSSLERFGTQQLTVEAGTPFNATKHENIGVVQDTDLATDSVAETVRPGWMMEQSGAAPVVLQKAQVKVAQRGPAVPPTPP